MFGVRVEVNKRRKNKEEEIKDMVYKYKVYSIGIIY